MCWGYSTVQYTWIPFFVSKPTIVTEEYERLKADPQIKHPEKFMLQHSRRQGQYQGCFAKWKNMRVAHRWDLFAEICPKQAKACSELPNHVRTLFGVETKKHTNSKFPVSDGSHQLPTPLIVALESILMERIHLGEEVTTDFASCVLVRLVSVWNEQLGKLTEDARGFAQRHLQNQDLQMENVPGEHQQLALAEDSNHMVELLSEIRECKISTNSPSVVKPGLQGTLFVHLNPGTVQDLIILVGVNRVNWR